MVRSTVSSQNNNTDFFMILAQLCRFNVGPTSPMFCFVMVHIIARYFRDGLSRRTLRKWRH